MKGRNGRGTFSTQYVQGEAMPCYSRRRCKYFLVVWEMSCLFPSSMGNHAYALRRDMLLPSTSSPPSAAFGRMHRPPCPACDSLTCTDSVHAGRCRDISKGPNSARTPGSQFNRAAPSWHRTILHRCWASSNSRGPFGQRQHLSPSASVC